MKVMDATFTGRVKETAQAIAKGECELDADEINQLLSQMDEAGMRRTPEYETILIHHVRLILGADRHALGRFIS